MKKEHSKRWIDTEYNIERSALELMRNGDREDLNVRAICEKAHVNRSTFYDHFDGVSGLLYKMELKMQEEATRLFKKEKIESFSMQLFIPLFKHIKTNKRFYLFALRRKILLPIKRGYDTKLLADIANSFCERTCVSNETERAYYITSFQAMIITCMRRWIETGCRETEEQIAEIVTNCIPKVLSAE